MKSWDVGGLVQDRISLSEGTLCMMRTIQLCVASWKRHLPISASGVGSGMCVSLPAFFFSPPPCCTRWCEHILKFAISMWRLCTLCAFCFPASFMSPWGYKLHSVILAANCYSIWRYFVSYQHFTMISGWFPNLRRNFDG